MQQYFFFNLLGVTQLRCSASQSRTFACGSMVLTDCLCGFSALHAEKPHTLNAKYRSAEGKETPTA
jgi:hypothetical protein